MRRIAVGFAVLALLAMASPALAQSQCTPCSQVIAWGTYTTTITGTSSVDCMWAEMNASGQINNICDYGFCHKVVTKIKNCTEQVAPFVVKYEVEYACEDCLDEPEWASIGVVEAPAPACVAPPEGPRADPIAAD